ncbi:MAG: tyrosine-type recombinase/integrase [Pigmentiphaga sp.]
MSVGKTEDGRFFCQYSLPHRKSPKKEYFGRGTEARKAAKARDAEIKLLKARNEEVRASSVYLDELGQAYLDHEQARGRKMKYLQEVVKLLNRSWLPRLSHVPVKNLKAKDFDQLAVEYREYSPNTFNRYINYLNIIFNFGVEFEHIPKNPMSAWRKRVLKKERRRELTIDEDDVKAILAQAPPHVVKAIKLIVNTGCRTGESELLKLTYDDVDFERKRIRIRGTKTERSERWVPLRDEFLEEIRRWRATAECDHLVEYKGRPVKGYKHAFNTAVRKAGIDRQVVPYQLRHFFASTLLAHKADLKAVSALMGHSSPDMLFRNYYHLMDDGERAAVELLPKF